MLRWYLSLVYAPHTTAPRLCTTLLAIAFIPLLMLLWSKRLFPLVPVFAAIPVWLIHALWTLKASQHKCLGFVPCLICMFLSVITSASINVTHGLIREWIQLVLVLACLSVILLLEFVFHVSVFWIYQVFDHPMAKVACAEWSAKNHPLLERNQRNKARFSYGSFKEFQR